MKFGVGQAVHAQGGRRAPARRRALCRRSCAGRPAARRGAALAARACALPHHRRREGQGHAGRARSCSPAPTSPSSATCRARRRCRAPKIVVPPYPILARDEVRHVGDAVAFVVADTLDQARDAAEAIEIEWEPLPHVIGAAAALARGRAAGVAGPARQSRFRDRRSATRAATDARVRAGRAHGVAHARQSAPRHQLSRHPRRRRRIRRGDAHHAHAGQPGQPRRARRAVRACSRSRPSRCAWSRPTSAAASAPSCFPIANMRSPPSRRSSSASRSKWVADRSEHFLGDAQGRDNITTARLALDEDGRFLALDVDT